MDTQTLLIIAGLLFVMIMYASSYYCSLQVQNEADFLVADRKLGPILTTATVFSTWFGAGTLLTVTNEVAHTGLNPSFLDPLGAGLCLIVVGLFFATPLWKAKVFTLCDYFRINFDSSIEKLASFCLCPCYFGWVAVQFIALASFLNSTFGLDLTLGILLVCLVGTGYTMLGGMLSVALTDGIQAIFLLIGLIALFISVLTFEGSGEIYQGMINLLEKAERLSPTYSDITPALALLIIGTLGNIPGQDIAQRMFSARDAATAKYACIVAGILYIIFGSIPVLLGVSAFGQFQADSEASVITLLASQHLGPLLFTLFFLAVIAAVLSTIDSAMLALSSIITRNILEDVSFFNFSIVGKNRLMIGVVAIISTTIALIGESAYDILTSAYEVPMVSLLVPLTASICGRKSTKAAFYSIVSGASIWVVHFIFKWNMFIEPWLQSAAIPSSLATLAISFIAYLLIYHLEKSSESPKLQKL